MKNLLLSSGVTILLFFVMTDLTAQSFVNTDPAFNKVLVDNDKITAIEVTFEPGKKTSVHTHPAHFFYAMTPGKLSITMANGETQAFEMKAGDSGYFPPEGPHSTVNTGKQTVKILLVELKDQPYMPEATMKK